MTKDERLFKRALDVLDWAHDVFGLEEEGIATKTALRERLAQPDTDKNQLEWQKQQTEHWKQHCFDMMKKLQEKNGV